ncbi:hypothetical protein BDV95DRAFT_362154 [Massariosphaeria phaeospora]|uniref:Mid2 domain-containing protein n=1 Tax=Massariosphaeria phaeospora TaxID=100035 RepID=A0A7C8I816_9PLEO|nr:hypothetical protein BDV95DRAFT_362154 [Massariosphaeria phaeospora]
MPCYFRNGTQITDDTYQPCNTRERDVDSMCCALRHEENNHEGNVNDVCDPNGLCQNWFEPDGTGPRPMIWWREGCTDESWQSPFCLRGVCDGGQFDNEDVPVQKCSDGRWCCGDTDCCSSTDEKFTLAATVGVTSSSASTSATTSTPTSATAITTTAVPTPTATPPPSNPSGLATSAKIGIGVGVAIGMIVLFSAVFFWWKKSQRQQQQQKQQLVMDGASDGGQDEKMPLEVYAQEGTSYPVELFSDERIPVEAGGIHVRAELEGSDALLDQAVVSERR